jgi:D-alanyl-D-alanine carboxypeptidase (penicillin-binding protein 5/6)
MITIISAVIRGNLLKLSTFIIQQNGPASVLLITDMHISKRFLKRSIIPIVVLAVIAGYVAYAFTRPLPTLQPTVTYSKTTNAAAVSLPWPGYGEEAVGAVGYGVLATNGPQTPLPTASTIKILTALAVLKEKPLVLGEQGPTIIITQADVDSYNKYVAEDGSVARVAVGEQISEYQALQALLLPSANNMAETLARWAYGSIDGYATAANQLAVQLGMTATTVTDPSGFLPSTASSAHDLTVLGLNAMQDPVIAQIVGQATAVIPVQGTIHNVNQFLGEDGIIGIKTGNNDQDLGVYLFAAKHDVSGHSITIVGTVMDAQDLGTAMYDSLPIIRATGQSFSLTTVAKAGDVVGHYDVPWSKPVNAVVEKDISIITWDGDALKTSVGLAKLHAPVSTSKDIGALAVQNSLDKSNSSTPVVLDQPIAKPSWIWRLTHAF